MFAAGPSSEIRFVTFVVVALFLAHHLSTATTSSSSLSICGRVAAQCQKQNYTRASGGFREAQTLHLLEQAVDANIFDAQVTWK